MRTKDLFFCPPSRPRLHRLFVEQVVQAQSDVHLVYGRFLGVAGWIFVGVLEYVGEAEYVTEFGQKLETSGYGDAVTGA